jgi:hypothetical protein
MKKIILNTILISILLASLAPSSILAATANEFFTKTGTITEIRPFLNLFDQERNRIPAGDFVLQEYVPWYQNIFGQLLQILRISEKPKQLFSISANDNNTEFLIEVNNNYEKASFSDLKIGDNVIVKGRYWTTYGTAPPPKHTRIDHHYSAEKIIIKK